MLVLWDQWKHESALSGLQLDKHLAGEKARKQEGALSEVRPDKSSVAPKKSLPGPDSFMRKASGMMQAVYRCTVCDCSKESKEFQERLDRLGRRARCNDCMTCIGCGTFYKDAGHFVRNTRHCTNCVEHTCFGPFLKQQMCFLNDT